MNHISISRNKTVEESLKSLYTLSFLSCYFFPECNIILFFDATENGFLKIFYFPNVC